nr:putative movement protein [Cymbidium chlorotic mosaic virus]
MTIDIIVKNNTTLIGSRKIAVDEIFSLEVFLQGKFSWGSVATVELTFECRACGYTTVRDVEFSGFLLRDCSGEYQEYIERLVRFDSSECQECACRHKLCDYRTCEDPECPDHSDKFFCEVGWCWCTNPPQT